MKSLLNIIQEKLKVGSTTKVHKNEFITLKEFSKLYKCKYKEKEKDSFKIITLKIDNEYKEKIQDIISNHKDDLYNELKQYNEKVNINIDPYTVCTQTGPDLIEIYLFKSKGTPISNFIELINDNIPKIRILFHTEILDNKELYENVEGLYSEILKYIFEYDIK